MPAASTPTKEKRWQKKHDKLHSYKIHGTIEYYVQLWGKQHLQKIMKKRPQ